MNPQPGLRESEIRDRQVGSAKLVLVVHEMKFRGHHMSQRRPGFCGIYHRAGWRPDPVAQSGLHAPRPGVAVMAAIFSAIFATDAIAALGGEEPRQSSRERTLCTGRSDTPWERQIGA